jgi:hypothetical protein
MLSSTATSELPVHDLIQVGKVTRLIGLHCNLDMREQTAVRLEVALQVPEATAAAAAFQQFSRWA